MREESMILEESETLGGDRAATVRTNRGTEQVVNVDRAVVELANFFADMDHEQSSGWTLQGGWYEQRLTKLRAAMRSGL